MAVLTPEFLQTKTYSALRDRLVFQHGGGVQAGVWDASDFKVVQRAAGANFSVDVGAGFSVAPANDPGNAGFYHVQNDATVNVVQAIAAHATLPRLDKLILLVTDTTHGGDASDAGTLQWVTGTATAGTTLDNGNDGAHGAGAVPTGGLLLADALIPAAATTITTANIRDRRAWARGAFTYITRTTSNYTTTSLAHVSVDSTNLAPRIECTGVPLLIELAALGQNTTSGNEVHTSFSDNGVGAPAIIGAVLNASAANFSPAGYRYLFTPTAGSHLFLPTFKTGGGGGTATLFSNASTPLSFSVREVIQPNTNNS